MIGEGIVLYLILVERILKLRTLALKRGKVNSPT